MVWELLVLLLLNVQETDARTLVMFIMLLVAAMNAMMIMALITLVYFVTLAKRL